jgi:hypothetical protein
MHTVKVIAAADLSTRGFMMPQTKVKALRAGRISNRSLRRAQAEWNVEVRLRFRLRLRLRPDRSLNLHFPDESGLSSAKTGDAGPPLAFLAFRIKMSTVEAKRHCLL